MDAKGNLIRKYSSNDTVYNIPPVDLPLYWIRPQQILSAQKGSHRFLWDMHYTPFDIPPSYPIAAIYRNTAPRETAPWVMPGTYSVKLTVDGKNFVQTFKVRMDPRVKTSLAGLQKQNDLSMICYEGQKKCIDILHAIDAYRLAIKSQVTNTSASAADQLNKKDRQIAALENTPRGSNEKSFGQLNGIFASLRGNLQNADMPPTSQVINAVNDAQKQLNDLAKKWNELKPKQ